MTPADIHQLTGTMSSQTKQLESVDKSLFEVVKLLKKREEKDDKRQKKAEQEKRRRRADSGAVGIQKMLQGEKAKAKSGGGVFGDIVGGLLKSALIVKAVGVALAGGLAAAIASPRIRTAFSNFMDNTVKPVVGRIWDEKIKPALESFWKDFIVPETKKLADTISRNIGKAINKNINPMSRINNRSDDNIDLRDKRSRAQSKLNQSIDETERAKIKEDIKKLDEAIALEDKLNRKARDIRNIRTRIAQDNLFTKPTKARDKRLLKEWEEEYETLKQQKEGLTIPEGYQKGGAISVPGMGQGDKVPMMLPPGSFVLNRNASKYMHASGGMIPTMLEPGEMVFPHTTPGLMAMNQMIPRFQTGGVVETSHADTGSGYQPGGAVDYKSRPVVLSKPAAEAFLKMMKDSQGQVKGSDVTSSKRSAEKNAAVGGVPNSNHLTGNAIDIHGGSKAWMKSNASMYGWTLLPPQYTSHDGHFDFAAGGAGSKNETTEKKNELGGAGGGTGQTILQQLTSGLNTFILEAFGLNIQEGLSHFAKGFGKPGMFDNLFGGGGGGGGGMSSSSPPLTGSVREKAKMMHDYIVSKGYTSAQAKGIVANIHRESTFNPSVRSGDDGGPGGLFQWKGSRQTPTVAALVNSGNWKGQIDYALREDAGPRYQSETAGMSAYEASMWWAKHWERPASLSNASAKHSSFIPQYNFQKGGSVPGVKYMSGYDTNNLFRKANDMKLGMDSSGAVPIIINNGGGGAMPQVVENTNAATPTLPDNPISDFSVGLIMNNNILSNRIGG